MADRVLDVMAAPAGVVEVNLEGQPKKQGGGFLAQLQMAPRNVAICTLTARERHDF